MTPKWCYMTLQASLPDPVYPVTSLAAGDVSFLDKGCAGRFFPVEVVVVCPSRSPRSRLCSLRCDSCLHLERLVDRYHVIPRIPRIPRIPLIPLIPLKPRSRKLLAARNPNAGSRPPSLAPLQEGAWGVRGVEFTAFCAYFEHAGVGFECCITAVLHHFWASSPLAGPLTATHCGCASCAMACGGTLSAPAGGVARSACIAGETRKAGYSHHVAKPVVVLILSFDHHCHWRSLRSLLFETATPRPYAPSPKCTKPSARTLNCSRHGRFTWTCI